jgi:hypothetical protein
LQWLDTPTDPREHHHYASNAYIPLLFDHTKQFWDLAFIPAGLGPLARDLKYSYGPLWQGRRVVSDVVIAIIWLGREQNGLKG